MPRRPRSTVRCASRARESTRFGSASSPMRSSRTLIPTTWRRTWSSGAPLSAERLRELERQPAVLAAVPDGDESGPPRRVRAFRVQLVLPVRDTDVAARRVEAARDAQGPERAAAQVVRGARDLEAIVRRLAELQ